ncbi:MAG: D-alanyl-D-alanine carboxypeptidase [Clostridia bacterium]|nr:D-alanyl-D-alanine carboxypeptidase [Clostridia bacterium]
MTKKIISVFFAILIVALTSFSAVAYTPTGFEVDAKSALLISMDTNEVLYEKNADQKVYPASITKIMTVILMLENKNYNENGLITMTEDVDPYITGTDSSVSNIQVGEQIRQIDLCYYVLMSSAGDCAYLAALTYGGSVENFVKMMNDKAQKLGLKGTHYGNPVGLHDEQTYTTARDTAELTKYALKNETFKKICESTRYTVPATNMSGERILSTTNFLHDNTTDYFYQYAHGVKTGYTDEAGRCLVSTATLEGYNYMCVLFGCTVSDYKRYEFIDSRNLYRWAFNNFSYKEIADTKNPVCEVPLKLASDTDYLPLYVEDGFISVMPDDADMSTVIIKPHIKEDFAVSAPVKKGQKIATADIIYAEKVIGTVNLISHDSIKANFFLVVLDKLKAFFGSSYMIVVYVVIAVIALIFLIQIIRLNKNRIKKRKVKYIPFNKDDE